MDLGLEGKRALITGASKGIGRMVATRLLQEGASVGICARGDEQLQKTAAELRPLGTVVAEPCDTADPESIKAWVKSVADQLGGVDIVISNASASGQAGEGPEPWLSNFQTDLLGSAMLYEAAKPFLERSNSAAIVQIATITAIEHHDVPISPSYGACKAATINLIAQLAQRWGGLGIRANTVSPGPIEFEGGVWAGIREMAPELYNRDAAMHPTGRMGTDEEVADVVTFLASPRAAWVNGANVVVDGGYTKQVGF